MARFHQSYKEAFFTITLPTCSHGGPDFTENEIGIARSSVQACFNMREEEIQTDEDPTTLDNTNEESEQPVSGVVLRHRLNEVYLRRTAIDFGRCLVSGSVAGFSLRNNMI